MLESAKDSMKITLQRWTDKTNGGGGSVKINLIEEVSTMFTSILLKCALGDDLH